MDLPALAIQRTFRSTVAGYGIAIGAVLIALGVRLLLEPLLDYQLPYITFFLAITAAGWAGGRGPATFAVIASAIAADFFFLEPIHTLFIIKADAFAGLVIFMVMGTLIVMTCDAMKRAQRRAEEQAALLDRHRNLLEQQMSEVVRHKAALSESEGRLRAMFSQAAVGIALLDKDGRFLEVNDAICNIMGYTAEELYGLTWADITYPADWERNSALMARLVANEEKDVSVEQRYVRKDGTLVWGNVAVAGLLGTHEAHTRLIAVVQDISTRKHAEEALRERECHLQDTIAELEHSRVTLNEKVQELEAFHDVVVDRELKMMELEKEIVKLRKGSDEREAESHTDQRPSTARAPQPLTVPPLP